MSRFSDIQKGKKARKNIEFPAPIDAADPAARVYVDLIVLSGDEESEAHRAARAYAISKGSPDPKEGDVHYDLGVMVHLLVRACVDPDVPGSFAFFFSAEENAELLPDGAFDRMAALALSRLDRERICFLHEQRQIWQDTCSPWGPADDENAILAKLDELEGVIDPARPFAMWRPATVGSLLLTTVKQRAALLRDRSPSGSSFGSGTSSSTKSGMAEA